MLKNIGKKSRKIELFPTFAKLYKHIPPSLFELSGFILLVILCGGLLLEQVTLLYFGSGSFDLIYTVVGIMMLCLLLLYLGFLLCHREYAVLNNLCLADWALVFFLVWSAISVMCSENPAYCFVGSSYRKEGLVTYFIYGAVIAIAGMIHSEKYRTILLRLVAVVGYILAVYAWIFSGEKTYESSLVVNLHPGIDLISGYTSVFRNANHFGYFLTMAILTQAGLFLLEEHFAWRWMSLGMFSVSFFVLLLNNTLGGFLAVTLGLIFLFVIVMAWNRKMCVSCVVLVASWLVMLLLSQIRETTMSENFLDLQAVVLGSTERRSTSSQRLEMWKQCLEMILEKPILGTGLEGSGNVVFLVSLDRPHNEYLQHALFTGIPGLTAYLTALVSIFIRCVSMLKKLSAHALILGTVVFGYCVSAFVGNTMYYTTIYYVMFLGLLIGAIRNCEN